MNEALIKAWALWLPIVLPALGGVLVFLTPKNARRAQNTLSLLASAGALAASIALFGGNQIFKAHWAGFGMDAELRLYSFSSFIILTAASSTFLVTVYSAAFMKGKKSLRQFFGFVLLTSSFVTGAALANNLVLMIFFWEGLLAMLFPLILTGGLKAAPTAMKALVLNGVAGLCLILGGGITAWLSGTMTMDKINLPLNTFWGGFAYILMMLGAIGKTGAVPFHTWVPDAAMDAPLPFMALLPAALEKLLGIYLLARISMDLFQLQPGSGLSLTVMIFGSCTIIFAVMMALIQKDYKRLLAYHAISQVGYMILGIGTALPIGIVGGLFHMLNNVMYKSGLYLSAGSVERQAGTTDLRQLGGLYRKMPVTMFCFLFTAAGISGLPPFNGFFSKELVFDAALEIHPVFFVVAALGAFFTAASFLKLGHAVYFGKPAQEGGSSPGTAPGAVKEAPWPMLAPMLIIALGCLLFGVYNALPLRGLIEPVLGARLHESFSGLPKSWTLTGISLVVLALAVLNHYFGVKRAGRALGASDHIHYAPGLKTIYGWAEARLLDPYEIGMKLVNAAAKVLFAADRVIDWFYNGLAVGFTALLSRVLARLHTGKHWVSVLWVLAGAAAVALIFAGVGG